MNTMTNRVVYLLQILVAALGSWSLGSGHFAMAGAMYSAVMASVLITGDAE